ncbi:alpha-tocopherol transfer protein-like isoform X2 [Odontomachus brunneus]|uniref:alpha-tocopherol transfer protein-like isoform X2 n=1 Tax=Odontomachus brunneus TaxID=486640 RepID=UPI0013F20913|nr:alpha-tocopherol transfer protein-like isoform X2 [Odontomachus brunneus]
MIMLEMITIKEAAEEAGGNQQIFEEMFNKFRQWLQQQLHLPQEITDRRLQCTLLCSKFDLEKAKKRLDSLYTLHNLIPEFFSDYDPLSDSIARFHKSTNWVPLPKLTPQKYRVNIGGWRSEDSSMFNLQDVVKYLFMITDVRAEEDTVNNELIIWDCKHLTLGHMLKYTPSTLKKCDLCLEAYGFRFKAIYMINAPSFIGRLLSVLKMTLKAKLFNRIHVSESGIESLYEAIPKSILPMDYGGDEPSMKILTDIPYIYNTKRFLVKVTMVQWIR